MVEKKYSTYRLVDGKVRQVIVDENGKMINRNPTKDELKDLEREPHKDGRGRSRIKTYTNKELLDYLGQFVKENGRIPVKTDFENNPGYPYSSTYQKRFGSWSNALKLVGMDQDTMVKQGNLKTTAQKARYAEIKVINHFKQHPIDLSGENRNSSCDGICPNGKVYDVKSSKFRKKYERYEFNTGNKYREEIEIYYFLAFNEDYTKLMYAWRVPGEIVEKETFQVGLSPGYEFNIENMEEYDITDKLRDVL